MNIGSFRLVLLILCMSYHEIKSSLPPGILLVAAAKNRLPEDVRAAVNAGIPNVEMRYLSMGMSNSFKIAIEEGANIVRIGTRLFGNVPSETQN